jgi:hypothetical protein
LVPFIPTIIRSGDDDDDDCDGDHGDKDDDERRASTKIQPMRLGNDDV